MSSYPASDRRRSRTAGRPPPPSAIAATPMRSRSTRIEQRADDERGGEGPRPSPPRMAAARGATASAMLKFRSSQACCRRSVRKRAEHHAVAEGTELQQIGKPDARIAPRRAQLRPPGCDVSGMAGAALARRAALQAQRTPPPTTRAHSAAASHIVICPAVSASTPGVGQALRQPSEQQHQHGRAQALAKARQPDQPAARCFGGRYRPAPSLTWCRWRRRPPRRTAHNPRAAATVRAIGYNRNPAASHRKPKAYTGASADLVRQRAEWRDQAQRQQLVGEIERRNRAALQVGGQPEVHGQQVGLHVAHEGEQPDRDERRI